MENRKVRSKALFTVAKEQLWFRVGRRFKNSAVKRPNIKADITELGKPGEWSGFLLRESSLGENDSL